MAPITRDILVSMEETQRERRRQRAIEGNFPVVRLAGKGVEAVYGVQSESGYTYEVEILSLREGVYLCSCPDYLTNTLGTCKHVEAVLLYLGTEEKPALAAARFDRPPQARVYLYHGEELQVRLLRPRTQDKELTELFDLYFDGEGHFVGELWRDFGGFARSATTLGAVRIDPEVHAHVRELREAARRGATLARRESEVRAGAELGATRVPLAPYQRLGALFLAYRQRAILADEMGLDKTVQAIAAAELLRRDEGVERVLVLTSPGRRTHWIGEIERCAGEAAARVEGDQGRRRAAWRRAACYTVAGYDILLRDREELEGLKPDLLVLDDAQRLRDWRSKTAEAVKRIASRHAFVLADTPLDRDPDHLYSVMQVVDQRLLGPLWRFNRRNIVADESGHVHGQKNQGELCERIRPAYLRRRRIEVAGEAGAPFETGFRVVLPAALVIEAEDASAKAAASRRSGKGPGRKAFEILAGLTSPPEAAAARADEAAEVVADLLADPDAVVVLAARSEPALAAAGAALTRAGIGTGSEARVKLVGDGNPVREAGAETVLHLDFPAGTASLTARRALGRAGAPLHEVWLVAEGTLEERLFEAARRHPDLRTQLDPEAGQPGSEDAWRGLLAPPLPASEPPPSPVPRRVPEPPDTTTPQGRLFVGDPAPAEAAPGGRSRRATPPPPAAPADPGSAAAILAAALKPVLGEKLLAVEHLGTGLVAVVSEDPTRLRGTVRALARGLGLSPMVLDEASLQDLRLLFAAAPPMPASAAGKARGELDRGRAKLSAGGALLEAGIPHEAIAPLHLAMESAARAMLLACGDEVASDEQLISRVYSRLVRGGRLGAAEAGSLSRVRDLAELVAGGAGDLVDRPLARAVLQDARRMIELATGLVEAPGGPTA